MSDATREETGHDTAREDTAREDTARENTARETATLGGGCFWCLDGALRGVRGVYRVESGYAGGHVERPSYEQVCSGSTGHAEVVRVEFDPQELPYRELLNLFFALHDPTTKDRQGHDVGPQYRSIVLVEDDGQERIARDVMAELQRQDLWGAPIVTEVERLTTFWPAEPVHQNYFANHPDNAYCAAVVGPKVAKFRSQFAERLQDA
ncbi:MAG: peptide-methionine (S)-S-oxide reductase MsrA [Trueperaceae bacterium]